MAAPFVVRRGKAEDPMPDFVIERVAPPVADFINHRADCGWGILAEGLAAQALAGSLAAVTARDGDGRVVGFARAVGDPIYVYVQDVIVAEGRRGSGLGQRLMSELLEAVAEACPHAAVMLMCATGREAFYERLGFVARPRPGFGPGMQLARASSGVQSSPSLNCPQPPSR